MTIEETKFLLMSIEALYPNCTFKDPMMTSRIWNSVLYDQDSKMMMNALGVYARTDSSGFAPSPGKLIDIAHESVNPSITAEEAVDMVRKAVGNSIYNSVEEFNKLPLIIQKAVISPQRLQTWAQTDIEEFETVCMSHFRKAYKIQVQREQQLLASEEDIFKISSNFHFLLDENITKKNIS